MRIYTQKGLTGGADYELADCRDETCDFYMVTLSVTEHTKLTPARITQYCETVRRYRENNKR